MSGPWDRPSSDDPDAWPSEDFGPSGGTDRAGARSSSDLSRADRDPATEGAPGWDDWPSAPPPQDDYFYEEPIRPSSDPWAESWTVEEADAMLGSAPPAPEAPVREWEPPAPQWEPPAREWEQPAPRWEAPPTSEPEAGPEPPPDRYASLETAPEAEPHIEPWTPEADPWRFEPDVPAAAIEPAVEPAPAEPGPEPIQSEPIEAEPVEPEHRYDRPESAEAVAERIEPEPRFDRPEPAEAVAEPSPEAAPEPIVRWPARPDELPDWLAEPLPESQPAHDTAPPTEQMAPAADSAAEAPEGPTDEAGPVLPEPEPPSVPFWKSILPWRSSEPSEAEADDQAAIEAEPAGQVEPDADIAPDVWESVAAAASSAAILDQQGIEVDAEAEPEPEPLWPEPATPSSPPIAASWEPDAPETVAEAAPAPPTEETTLEPPVVEIPAEPPPFIPITGGLTYETPEPRTDAEADASAVPPQPAWPEVDGNASVDPWAAAVIPEPAVTGEPWPVPEPEPEPEPEPQLELETQPAAEAAADVVPAADVAAEPAAAEPWADVGQGDPGESTRVLPTDWIARTLDRTPSELESGPIRTRLGQPDADVDEEEPATVAEQAVPWLIGVILLLAGMVIVLLALIFAGDGSLGGGAPSSPTPSPSLAAVGGTPPPTPTPTPEASATPDATASATPSKPPAPEYGPLEMVYQGRSAALAPIYLLHRDFTIEEDPEVLAQDAELDVRRFAWSPDGRVGAALLADVLVSIEPGEAKRRLGDGLSALTFGDDPSRVYAVRVTEDGENDVATVLAIDFESGDTEELASVTYERPSIEADAALEEAAFSDDGGPVRIFWTARDHLRLWVLGAGAWTVDPAEGKTSKLEGDPLPVLWSPDGESRIDLTEEDGTTALTLRNGNNRALASTEVEGVVSHVRWSPQSNRIVFTLGRSAANGGILQDLFLWDLGDGQEPMQITNTGAGFGAEWLGTHPMWREE